jgi:hypothetical protein
MTMTKQELDRIFTYHPPRDGQQRVYEAIRNMAREFAEEILGMCPDCAERDRAIERIEEAVMWANAGIARAG